jgi:transposase
MNEQGVEIDQTKIETNGRLLIQYVRSIGGKKKLTFEESELSRWLYARLNEEVDELIVCNPVYNRSYKRAKTDKLDARELAKLLRGNFLRGVYHDNSGREHFRDLMSAYEDIIKLIVRIKNQHKSIYRKEGEKVKGEQIYNKDNGKKLKEQEYRFISEMNYKLLESSETIRQKYLEEIKKYSRKFKEIKRIKSIPGIGDILAAKIVSQVINPRRFRNKYKYWSYCGLVNYVRESDGRRYGREENHGNKTLKCVYKMAAHSAIRGDNAFRKYYEELLARGKNEGSAKNAVSRRIAALSLRVWRKEEKYYDDRVLKTI